MEATTRPDAESAAAGETCICLAVQRAGRAVGRRFDEAFRSLDLTNWQYSILATLDGAGNKSVGDLAALLGADRTTVTGNLKPLERRSLVASEPDQSDRRIRIVRLTAEGHDLLARGARLRSQADADIEKLLRGIDRPSFIAALAALSAENVKLP